jgi:ribonuclease HI
MLNKLCQTGKICYYSNMVTMFTDGSSRGNPGPGGWGAVIISDSHSDSHSNSTSTVVELGGREGHTTNNRMELVAAIEALRYVVQLSKKVESIRINSDSSYVINGITKWVHGWAKKDWITSQKKEVLNRDLWEKLMVVTRAAAEIAEKISWQYVGGHVGIVGNERCDEIATSYADNNPVKLFSGVFADYPLQTILNLNGSDVSGESDVSQGKLREKSRKKSKAYSYVSMVDGVIMTDATWKECEARVKGVHSARYKKALNPTDEAEIIADFKS